MRLGIYAVLVTLVLGLLVAPPPAVGPLPQVAAESSPKLTDLRTLEEFQAMFNADRGVPRIILLLSPTGPVCRAGARWVQKQILAQNPTAGLRVYAVWFNMLYTDARSEWPQHLLNDPRVVHLGDEKKIVGQWAARQVRTYYGVDPGLLPRNVLWDAYLLYAPEARWDDSRLHFIKWGKTIIATRDELRTHLKGFFGEGAASLAVMVTVMREPERR